MTTVGGALPKIPLIPQQGTAVNLRIPNPVNIRLTGGNIMQASKPSTLMTAKGPIMMNTRPPTGQIMGQAVTQVTAQAMAQTGTPQTVQAAQVLTQVAATTVLPPGTKLVTPQLTTSGVQMTQQALVTAKLPIKVTGHMGTMATTKSLQGSQVAQTISNQIASVSTATISLPLQMAVPATAVPTQGSLAASNTLPTSLMSPTSLALATSTLATSQPYQPPISTTNSTPAITTTPLAITATPVAIATTGPATTGPAVITGQANVTKSENIVPTFELCSNDETKNERHTVTIAIETEKKDGREHSEIARTDENGGVELDGREGEGEGDFDPMKVMEWENGIGTLPGSSLKVSELSKSCNY